MRYKFEDAPHLFFTFVRDHPPRHVHVTNRQYGTVKLELLPDGSLVELKVGRGVPKHEVTRMLAKAEERKADVERIVRQAEDKRRIMMEGTRK